MKRLMLEQDVLDCIGRVSFRDWTFRYTPNMRAVYVVFAARCSRTGAVDIHWGRRWYIPELTSESEIVKTCWLAVEVALRHEAMEEFLLNGIAIFDPHTDVDALGDLQIRAREAAR